MRAIPHVLSTAVALALCAPIAGCSACEPDRSTPNQTAASATPSAPAVMADAGVGLPAPAGTASQRKVLPCRAIAVDGEVRIDAEDGGAALARQDEVEPGHWVWLSPDARLVAKDPRTTRETTFRGLGHVRPCVGLAEESWVTSGTFESSVGAGEIPGAEEWVVTPLGVVRFGAAKLFVDAPVGSDMVRIGVGGGTAFVWPAQDASAAGPDGGVMPSPVDEGWARISGASAMLTRSARRPPPEAARMAVDACRTAGRSAHDLATVLVSVNAGAKTAAAQVTARRLARAACAVAAIRVDALFNRAAKEALSESLKEADTLWRSLPVVR